MTANGDELLLALQKTTNQNAFVMMRYRPIQHFSEIETCIRNTLKEFDLIARLAKDGALVHGLWGNLEIYMKYSRFGIAVFEDIDERDFNPNIPLELGYMLALGKRCLILKERRMPLLPTDILGLIYRPFDVLNLRSTLRQELRDWCGRDLGLQRKPKSSTVGKEEHFQLVYDSRSEDPSFRTWGRFSTILAFYNINLNSNEADDFTCPVIELKANGSESMGINKSVQELCGRVRLEYKAISSGAPNPNLLFCMIPMQGGQSELLEVGAQVCAELANAYSPYRIRYFVPEANIGDNEWHTAEINFDFRSIPVATYSVFAPRINEGCPRPGPGVVLIRSFQLFVNPSGSRERAQSETRPPSTLVRANG